MTPAERTDRVALGLMTGTSLDGLDLCVARVTGRFSLRAEILWCGYVPFPERVRRSLGEARTGTTSMTAEVHYTFGRWVADRTAEVLPDACRKTLDCIGFHGQTLVHHSGQATLQIGEPAFLARRFRVPVVSNFRAGDIAAGGTGAPLIPRVDQWLFHDPDEFRATLNLGGIANLTLLPPGGEVTGFDTGPGMALLDDVWRRERQGPFDPEGSTAEAGRVDRSLVENWLGDDFIPAPPPKSTGRDRYGPAWVDRHRADLDRLSFPDRLATLAALTAGAVALNLRRYGAGAERVIASGSGTRHRRLWRELEPALAPADLSLSSDWGIPADSKEALGFALLAVACLADIPGNIPTVTGAAEPVRLGTVTYP